MLLDIYVPPLSQSAYTNSKPKISWNNAFSNNNSPPFYTCCMCFGTWYYMGGWPHSVCPSVAFWHLPSNSARIGFATEGALLISARLSADAAITLGKVGY